MRLSYTLFIGLAAALLSPCILIAQDVVDVSEKVHSEVKKSLSKAKVDQPLTTFKDYTGKSLGVKNGWLLKARGSASVEKVEIIEGEVFRIDYPEVKLPNGKVKPAYSDFSGNLKIDVRWRSNTRGEKWIVAGPVVTLGDVLWGNANPKGKGKLKVEFTKSGAKVDIKLSEVVVEPDTDTRASEFAKERLADSMIRNSVIQALKKQGIAAAK